MTVISEYFINYCSFIFEAKGLSSKCDNGIIALLRALTHKANPNLTKEQQQFESPREMKAGKLISVLFTTPIHLNKNIMSDDL